MSVNAISGYSIYEYYYQINNNDNKKNTEKTSVDKELEKYGITPTSDEQENVALLKKAKETEEEENDTSTSYYSRPWADLMQQLNIAFHTDPKDDIRSIKEALRDLLSNIEDEDLTDKVEDLITYTENLYIGFEENYSYAMGYSAYSKFRDVAAISRMYS